MRVSLAGVGENFQDQGNNALIYNATAEAAGVAVSQTFASAADIFGGRLGEIARSTRNELPRWAEQIVSASGGAGAVLNKSAVESVLSVQHDLVFGARATTLAEYTTQAMGDGTLASRFWALYPFSRGSVHLSSASVSSINQPRIDPRFNLIEFDLATQSQICQLARRLRETGRLSSLAAGRIQPSLDALPKNATEAQWGDFIRTTSKSCPASYQPPVSQ